MQLELRLPYTAVCTTSHSEHLTQLSLTVSLQLSVTMKLADPQSLFVFLLLLSFFLVQYQFTKTSVFFFRVSQVALQVKNPPAKAGDAREAGQTPGSGRSPGVGNGKPLQFSCLENSMSRGALWATAHGVAENRAQLNN